MFDIDGDEHIAFRDVGEDAKLVTSKVVHCKDCAYNSYDEYCMCHHKHFADIEGYKPNYFCASGVESEYESED